MLPGDLASAAVYRKRYVFAEIVARQDHFRRDFLGWLSANYSVWLAFEREADRVWDRGRRHYSARTIGEYLRHESALRETQNEHGWKLSDWWWPDLARLYMLLHPERTGFFETRVNPLSKRAA